MGPGQLFDMLRSYHSARFNEVVQEAKENANVVVEPALLASDGSYAVEGDLELRCRFDLVVVEGGTPRDSITIDTEEMVSFEAFSFNWDNGVRIEIALFQWNLCTCSLSRGEDSPDWGLLMA